jgi:predicted anti-sigma-YlaC factor YlaD
VTGIGRCTDVRLALGVYVLGAAEPAERALVRMHLAWCRDCREELAALAGLPGLLRRVPAAEADKVFSTEAERGSQADPLSAATLPRLLARTARTRRTRRWLALAATAVAVVLAAGGGVTVGDMTAARAVPPPGPAASAWKTVSARSDVALASATVAYAPAAWGTNLKVRVIGVAPGTVCLLWVTGTGGQKHVAGGWTMVFGQYGWIPASTSIPVSRLRGFAVTAGGKPLVTVPVSAL